MSYVFKGEYHTSQDWATPPAIAEMTIDDAMWERIPAVMEALKNLGGFSMEFMWETAYKLYDEEGEPFEYEITISSVSLVVYADGDVGFTFHLQHLDEEDSTGPMKYTEGVKL